GVTIKSGAGINNTFVPFQLVGGAELRPLEMKNWSYFGELGLNLNKSFSYVSLAVAYRFEDVRSQSNPGF
ncbi:MAG: hypothetical protein RBT63_09300, partial [Bdellovibrionales bacterium]|nr:hypothetical protein [Bdellovibrionales bacterium]